MELKYKISDLNIKISTDFDLFHSGFCDIFSSDFEKEDVEIIVKSGCINRVGELVFSSERTDVLKNDNIYSVISKDRQYNNDIFCIEQKNGKYSCTLNFEKNDKLRDMVYIWNSIDFSHLMLENNRVVLHGSFVLHNGKAVIFSGKSGIGKSTQANLWEKYENAEIVNGDKTILFVKDDKLFASSLPIAGTSGICKNVVAEVKAIIMLGQSATNSVLDLLNSQKVGLLVSNCVYDSWRNEDLSKVVDLCTSFYDKTKIISFKCKPDKSSVDFLKAVIE